MKIKIRNNYRSTNVHITKNVKRNVTVLIYGAQNNEEQILKRLYFLLPFLISFLCFFNKMLEAFLQENQKVIKKNYHHHQDSSFHCNLLSPSTMALRNSPLWRRKDETWPPVTHLTSEPGQAFCSSSTECFGIYPSS